MAVQGLSAGDFAALAQFAWKIYVNVRESRTNFGKLNIDCECLLVSIGSLDKGHTQELIADYIKGDDGETRQLEIRALRDGLNSVIMPFYAIFEASSDAFQGSDGTKAPRPLSKSGMLMYVEGPTVDPVPPRERPWRRWPLAGWMKRLGAAFELKDLAELRSRFAVQAANLNLFLTRLTHTQLQRQTELLTLRLAEQSLLRNNFRYSLDLEEASKEFRQDVASYVRFLLDGGRPYTETELQRRKAEGQSFSRTSMQTSTSYTREREDMRRARLPEGAYRIVQRQKIPGAFDDDSVQEEKMVLDDDARLKLASARQRLALADLTENQADGEGNAITFEEISTRTERPATALVRRKTEPAEKIIIPRQQRIRDMDRRSSPSSSFFCDSCDRPILADKPFYRCESGRCGGKGDSYDLCKRCYTQGENCPGFDKGVCLEMDQVVWKEWE